jgi:hypothetical protein
MEVVDARFFQSERLSFWLLGSRRGWPPRAEAMGGERARLGRRGARPRDTGPHPPGTRVSFPILPFFLVGNGLYSSLIIARIAFAELHIGVTHQHEVALGISFQRYLLP